jgi:NAD(P)-dependent dehydrogenase (short-subunit alcohol dehydrogenase family)
VAFRPFLAAAGESSAIAISSNSATCQPGWRPELVQACLGGDEPLARAVGDEGDSAAAYPATKMAVARWVRRQAPSPDWAGSGIRLNAIAPGLVETPFVQETRGDPVLGPLIGLFPLPLGRGGSATEIAELVVFLLGPAARFFCGSVIFCDGGTDALLRPDDWPARWDLPRRAT